MSTQTATTYTAHKPARKNARKVIVTDSNGQEWILNYHGVVIGYESDPHFEGMSVMKFSTWEETKAIEAAVIEQQPDYRFCRCCAHGLPKR